MSEPKGLFITQEQLDGFDRNARAYGFEIGKGHPLTEMLTEVSPDNPFVNFNWRDNVIKEKPKRASRKLKEAGK